MLLCNAQAPDAGDFSAFRSEAHGRAVLFWGSQCNHYSTKNTAETTRVSLDFRVVRADDFIDGYVSPLTDPSGKGGGAAFLNRGGHYTDTSTERAWRAEHQEQQ